jgi:TP53 regulating kinase-like protein
MEPEQKGELLEQGAEAKIYKINFENKIAILKERLPKRYRHPDLDKKLSVQRINFVQQILCRNRR